jgi:hypothetical protein
MIGAANLSPVTKLVTSTGAVSRYEFDRSQKTIMVQNFNCGHMSALVPTDQRERRDVRVQPLRIYLGSRSKSKKCDKLINPTIRFMRSYF